MALAVNGIPNGTSPNVEKLANWVPLLEQPASTLRKLRLVCIGAGFSGLILAHKIKHELKWDNFIDLKIYEKNSDIGGTWYENRYPGAAWSVSNSYSSQPDSVY